MANGEVIPMMSLISNEEWDKIRESCRKVAGATDFRILETVEGWKVEIDLHGQTKCFAGEDGSLSDQIDKWSGGLLAQHPGADKPPLGIEPEIIWIGKRSDQLVLAIARFLNAGRVPDPEWYLELKKSLNRLYQEEE